MSSRLMADLSDNNTTFDAHAYRAAGHVAIALKATEGVGFTDPEHGRRSALAHSHGLKIVHYHFARPDRHSTGDQEAVDALHAIRPNWRPGDRIALDLEVPAPITRAQLLNYVDDYRRVWHNAGHEWLWLYTFTSYLDSRLGGKVPHGWALWLADFRRLSRLEWLRRRVNVHQFADGSAGPEPHTAAGIGRCDMSKLSRRAHSKLAK